MTASVFSGAGEHSVALLLNDAGLGAGLEQSKAQSPPDDAALLDEYSRTVVSVADRVAPSVVNIDIKQQRRTRSGAGEIGGTRNRLIIKPAGFSLTKSPDVHNTTQN